MVIYKKIYCVFFILSLSFHSFAAEQLNALTEYLPPLNFEKNGKVTGFSTELLDLIALDAKVTLKKEMLPWPRAYSRAQKESNTLIYSIARTPERESQFQWLGPISSRRIMLYKLATRKDILIKNLDDARAYRIGVVREAESTRNLIRLGFDKLDLATDDENNMRKFKHGRFDLLLALNWSAAFNAEKLGLKDEIVPAQLVTEQTNYWFGISLQTDPALVLKMNQALHKIRKDGRLEKLKQKYISDFQK
ncbi:substrate-binding periplasmic protein [Iodobacter ciconiae]|uniref:Transporter substrate-binding domain-containing protein n=1 Tax=Iodobacter ciconiae TaxID=2496266 RepID=A0A3S8ZQ10_9NEIS|nr:transporter substrate-binding domain-containing protein [Iodobacter ciconiae]AZN35571.1 transporter substrate-binding domain-containing protein [Iodobacter ciconiae]